MADKGLSQQEKQRLKEKEQFERERKKWKQQESRKRVKKTRKTDGGPVLFKAVAVVLAAAIVLGLGSIYAGSYGVPGRFMTALTVGKQNIDAPVWAVNFYFAYRQMHQYASQYGAQLSSLFGMDTNASIFGQSSPYPRTEAEDSPKMTWDEYFRKQVNTSLQTEIALYSEAKKAGFELDKEDQDALEEMMTELKTQANGAAMSVGAYLRHSYAAGLTEKKYRQLQERQLVVQGFSALMQEDFRSDYSESDLQAEYDKDPSVYQQVDYRIYSFAKETLTANEGESEEALAARQAEANKAAKDNAEAFLREAATEQAFIAAAKARYDAEHQHGEDEEVDHEHDYDADAATINLRKKKADITSAISEDAAAWFFNAARKAGDSATWETDTAVYAAQLVRPAYAQTSVDIYAIDVPTGEDTHAEGEEHSEDEATPEEIAKKKADDLLAKWKADGGTKEAFAKLADEQPDPIRMEEGGEAGLVPKAIPGELTELDSWVFDPARKAGDATVLQTSSGYTVVYLSSQNADDFAWMKEISNAFVSADYEEYTASLAEQYPLGHHGIGMRFALKTAQKMCDAYMVMAAEQAQQSAGANSFNFG